LNKAKEEAKDRWKRLGWRELILRVVETKAFGENKDQIYQLSFYECILYLSLINAK
jgi:hypothetical protein